MPRTKKFDFTDIVGQKCYYSRVDECDEDAEVVIIRMTNNQPYFVCMLHGIKYLTSAVSYDVRNGAKLAVR